LASVEPPKRRAALDKRIDALRTEPRPPDSRKIAGVLWFGAPVYRIRSGSYRALYSISAEREITVLYVGHRREAYRKL